MITIFFNLNNMNKNMINKIKSMEMDFFFRKPP